jgi:FAD/FMN-containing dehydrogenase
MSFDALSRRLAGTLAINGDPMYGRLATGFNLAITPTPAAVVEALDARDVVESVRFAASAGLPIGVQATGHGLADPLDGALMVHTGRLDGCMVHPDGWARVGAGVRWQQVLDAAAPHGLAAVCGSAPAVGVVGYTTGGGLSPIGRTFGWASDGVRAAEIVTGDGELRRVTPTEHPDLFWAVRGGKGAVGIVTALEFDLLSQPSLYAGALYFDGRDADVVAHEWASWCPSLPDSATTSIALMQLPALPGVPPPLAGKFTVAVRFTWTGPAEQGEAALAPMKAVATPLIDTVQTIPFKAIGTVHSDPEEPIAVREETDLLHSMPSDAVDALLQVAGPGSGSPQVIVELRQMGGELAATPAQPSALCHRDAAFNMFAVGVLPNDKVLAHGRRLREAMASWSTGGALPNISAATGEERIARSYDEVTLARLRDVVKRYDPAHVLRAGQVPA